MISLPSGHAEVTSTTTRHIRVRLGGDGSPMAPHAKGPPPMDSEDDDVIVSDDFDGDSGDVVASDDLDISDQPGESMDDSEEDHGHGGATKPSKPRKQPVLSHDEQESLLAAQAGVTTSDASILELEVKELLLEVKAGSSHHASTMASLQSDLSALRCTLASMPPRDVTGASVAPGFIRDLGLQPEAVVMTFKPPMAVACVGSVQLKAAMRGPSSSPSSIDVAVVMPHDCLHARGHVNYRYHAHRAMYLELVAQALSKSSDFKGRKLQLGVLQNDPARPVLLVPGPASTGGAAPAYIIRLLPCAPPSAVQMRKLGPDRNAVRAVVAGAPKSAPPTAASNAGASAAAAEPPLLPTPVYNAGVLSDTLMLTHAVLLQRAASAAPCAMSDGLLLLKLWAAQQGLSPTSSTPCPDGLDSHMSAMVMAHLVQQGKLSASMSALQSMRAALHALCDPMAGLPKGVVMSVACPDTVAAAARNAAPTLLRPPITSLLSASGSEEHGVGRSGDKGTAAAAELAALVSAASLPPLPTPQGIAAFKKAGAAAVWVDPSGYCNLAANMTKSSAAAVTAAARATLTQLESPRDPDEAFTAAFLTPSSPATAFDYLWSVSVGACLAQPVLLSPGQPPVAKKAKKQGACGEVPSSGDAGGVVDPASALCKDVSIWREQEGTVESFIKKSLGDRAISVRAIRRFFPSSPSCAWAGALSTGLPGPARDGEVLVGATLDPTLALRLVDVGPPADDAAAAAKFRAFWGDAAELRRFKDGKISEAVVWGAGPGARHTIPDRIVSFAVGRHKPAGGSGSVRAVSGALDAVLRERPRGPEGEAELVAGIEPGPEDDDAYVSATRLLDSALEKLGRELRGLEGLALKVVGVLPLSPATRHTAPFPPRPHPLAGGPELLASLSQHQEGLARCLDPVHIMVQVENSGKWPSAPVPFAKLKAALGVQLAQALCKVGIRAAASEALGVDVFVDGFVFRLSLYSGRDEAMLAKQAAAVAGNPAAGPDAAPPTSTSSSWLLSSPEALPLVRSWHHGMVAGVAGANPAYAPTVRLAHRWLASHMLSNHFVPEAVELLVAYVFTHKSAVGNTPGSRVTGLLRFLTLLARHPWAQRPLVLDPDTGSGGVAAPLSSTPLGAAAASEAALSKPVALTAQVVRGLQSRFDEAKGKGVVPAMWIATPRDVNAVSPWTVSKPTREGLSHATALARTCVSAASALLEAQASSTSARSDLDASQALQSDLLSALFHPDVSDMDVVLGLRREALPQAHCSLPPSVAPRAPKRAAQPDALTAVLEGARAAAPPKRSRAFLDAFPEKAVEGRGPEALRAELLVGCDPLQAHFVPQVQVLTTLSAQALEGGGSAAAVAAAAVQGQSMATVCVDGFGGRMVGVKWAPGAFLPAVPKPHTAHLLVPCVATGMRGPTPPGAKIGPLLAVPNVSGVLAEVAAAGEGLVGDLLPVRSCHKLPC